MCTSAPATACPFESFTSPCSVAGPTGEAHAAVAEIINPAKPNRRESVNIRRARLHIKAKPASDVGINPTFRSQPEVNFPQRVVPPFCPDSWMCLSYLNDTAINDMYTLSQIALIQ